jgi:AcrR family transcriptional regulator
VSFEKIAKAAGVTRPLVHHYFDDKSRLFEFVVKMVRANFQNFAIESFAGLKEPEEMLRAYINSTFEWLSKFPTHGRLWLLFYYYCGIKDEYLQMNSELVEMGQKRIVQILEAGKIEGLFRFTDAMTSAKLIQTVITGALVELATEKLHTSQKEFRRQICSLCLGLVT